MNEIFAATPSCHTLLHHRRHSSEASGVTSATNMMAKYDHECEALTRRLNLSSAAQSEALAARLQHKRREMAERAVSMERLHQWILAQPVKESDAAEADAQQDQADEKAGTPHGCEVLRCNGTLTYMTRRRCTRRASNCGDGRGQQTAVAGQGEAARKLDRLGA